MNKKCLVFGRGFIGIQIAMGLDCDISSEYIYSIEDIGKEVEKYQADVLINCIGYTGENNTDDCEKNVEDTLALNTYLPIEFGEYIVRNPNKKLVQVSSGCLYSDRPELIKETDIPDFYDLFYSRTKIYEEAVLSGLSEKFNVLLPRIRIPLTNYPHHKNLLTKLLRYEKVIDVPNSITYIPDFIKVLELLIDKDARGIYNVVNKGALRYPELLDTYKKYKTFNYSVMTLEELGLARTNIQLSTEKLDTIYPSMRDIHDVLDECVREYLYEEKYGKRKV